MEIKIEKVGQITYQFDEEGYGFPIKCELGHEIEHDSANGEFNCMTCNKAYHLIKPFDGGY